VGAFSLRAKSKKVQRAQVKGLNWLHCLCMRLLMVQGRHLAKSHIEVAPPNLARRNEIIEEIVDHLRPWTHLSRTMIMKEVDRELVFLLILAPLEAKKRTDRALNRTHARRLDKALRSAEELLATAPHPLRSFVLNPLPTMKEDGVRMLAENHSEEEQIERANKERADSFLAEVKRMRKICSRAINPGLGSHPNYDRAMHLCAMFSYGLMRELSKREITGTKDAPFRTIASLLYQAISGQCDAELKRACDAQLRVAR
jgi:hypothetical protein